MKFVFVFILLFFYNYKIFADNDSLNKDKIEKEKISDIFLITSSRKVLNTLLLDTTNGLDYILSFGLTDGTRKKTSYIDFKIGPLYDKYSGFDYDYDISLHFDLPNTKKRFKIFINSIYDRRSSDDKRERNLLNKNKKEKFVLGLGYSINFFKLFNYGLSAGMTFNDYYPDPFLKTSVKLSINLFNNWNFLIGDYIYYFLRYKLDNTGYLALRYNFNDKTHMQFYNDYKYKEHIKGYEVHNRIGIYHVISNTLGLKYTINVFRNKEDLFTHDIVYLYSEFSFKHIFYCDWLYYEFSSRLYWRKKNNFKLYPKILIFIGIIYRSE